MLFKLSIKNMKKSMKDYVIYFLTLILGIAIFYIFNAMDSQQAMMNLNGSKQQIVELLIIALGGVSVFISIVLAFLIIYANNFLIKRRKKEFGIYMTLGMGKWKISKILLTETLLIGIISLGVGLVIGIFGSQLMSILVAKMFEANMSHYSFIFSQTALIKTIFYFGITYAFIMVFNVFNISRYKLIDLLTASRKSEKVKVKNSIVRVIFFLLSIAILGCAYYMVLNMNVIAEKMMVTDMESFSQQLILIAIVFGIVGTFLFFWSLSGFLLKLIQTRKKSYLKDLNMFTLRQISSKVNTTVFSMSIICLLLFLTICILSSAISLNNSMRQQIKDLTPVDFMLGKLEHDPKDDRSILNILEDSKFDTKNLFSQTEEVTTYNSEEVTWETTMKNAKEELGTSLRNIHWDTKEEIIKLSDYNRLATMYGKEQYTLEENQYLILCNFDQMTQIRNKSLESGTKISIANKEYHPKYSECKNAFIVISPNASNTGIIVVPDSAKLDTPAITYLAANYVGTTKEEKQQIEDKINNMDTDSKASLGAISALSKIAIYDASTGLGAIATFIGLYLGIIFLISGAAILALKELSESSDNQERYKVLRQIGANDKMINRSLFRQIGVFFLLPLGLAIIHSIFGLEFAHNILASLGKQDMLSSALVTAVVIVLVYGGYFIATYQGSKSIIKEK